MQENKKAKWMMGHLRHYRVRLLSLSRSKGGRGLVAEKGWGPGKKISHWGVYTWDVTAITVRTSRSTITLDLPA